MNLKKQELKWFQKIYFEISEVWDELEEARVKTVPENLP